MKTTMKASAVAVLAAALVAAPALADSPGQLEGGSFVYKVKNVTQSGTYSNAVSSVACGDDIKFSIFLHNTEFGALNNIVVSANLSNGTMTATPDAGGTTGTSGAVTVALGAGQSLSYNAGSTILYDGNGNVIKTLPNGITAGGVNVGTLNGSTSEFVNFEAKVNCPVTVTTTPPAPTPTPSTPLPQTGVEGAGIAGTAGVGALGYAVMAYRRSRKAVASAIRNR